MDDGGFKNHKGTLHCGKKSQLLLGIVAALYFKTNVNEVVLAAHSLPTKPVVVDKEMIDLGMVFNRSALAETVDAAVRVYGIK